MNPLRRRPRVNARQQTLISRRCRQCKRPTRNTYVWDRIANGDVRSMRSDDDRTHCHVFPAHVPVPLRRFPVQPCHNSYFQLFSKFW